MRPPAVPLVAHDPYFSIWSMNDKLTEGWTKHWTGTVQQMWGMARIDGKPYRFLGPSPTDRAGKNQVGLNDIPPAMNQADIQVTPTRTIYRFEAAGVRLTLTFLTPALPADLDVLSRPVTYLVWDAQAADNRTHTVELYFDASAQIAINNPEQAVQWSRIKTGDLAVMRTGTREQPILEKKGDNLRIDWGYFHLAVPSGQNSNTVIAGNRAARTEFAQSGRLPENDDLRMPRPANDVTPVLATAFALGAVSATPVSRYVLLAYDDLYSIEYFQRRLRPYWQRSGMDAGELLRAAVRDYARLAAECRKFDEELMTDLQRGGADYANLAVLAFRQTLAAHKLTVDFEGTPLYFSKENFSNGSIGTVDVT